MPLYIGLMSGTSMDGIDAVMLDVQPDAPFKVLGHVHAPFDAGLRASLFDLNESGPNEIHRAAMASNALARAYADVVSKLCGRLALKPTNIRAIGAHGQTIRHQPGMHDATGYTTQLLNGALLAELTGIDIVCDFRSRDVAAGGQGAPLVPAFHRAAFGTPGQDIAVLNLGGIANLSFLYGTGETLGHDCGPGNVLLDAWCSLHSGQEFDNEGSWAASGKPLPTLLKHLLEEPYLERAPPKSTGRDLFNTAWLQERLKTLECAERVTEADVQATLSEFTAQTVAKDVRQYMPQASQLLVCGGGAFNTDLLARLSFSLPATKVLTIQSATGLHAMHIEAAAFAWLAWAYQARTSGNCVGVTGAKGPRVLGALHLA
jgi:anhydro-N-acetylmuramic acid kinase